ncbi:MAG: hypothetical protein JXB05_02810 [Myxococcaceae bacterium]|nr:hypothetical protein [Myxococcaceae bacterium]
MREVRGLNSMAITHFGVIRNDFELLREAIETEARESAEEAFQLDVALARTLFSADRYLGFETAYIERLTRFYQHAMSTARRSAFSGPSALSPVEPTWMRRIAKEILGRGRVDLLFATLPAIVESCGSRLSLAPEDTLRNPVEWARGAEAFLEARTIVPEVSVLATAGLTKELWKEGLFLRNAAIEATSPVVLRAAAKKVRAHYDSVLRPYLKSVFEEWGAANLKRYLFRFHGHSRPDLEPDRRYYGLSKYPHESNPDGAVSFDEDPVEAAVAAGLIRKKLIESKVHTGTHSWTDEKYHLEVISGRYAGFVLGAIKESWHHDDYRSRRCSLEVRSLSHGGESIWWVTELGEVLGFCIRLLREHSQFDVLRKAFPEVLKAKLKLEDSVLDHHEALTGSAALLGVLGLLCGSRAPFTTDQLSVKNAPMLVAREELAEFLSGFIVGDWFLRVRDVDLDRLMRYFRTPSAAARTVLSRLSPELRAEVEALSVGPLSADFRSRIVVELNRVIAGPSLKDASWPVDLKLDSETQYALRSQLPGDERKLNRLLLLDAFPEAFPRSALQGRGLSRLLTTDKYQSLATAQSPFPWWSQVEELLASRASREESWVEARARRLDGVRSAIEGPLVIDETLRRIAGYASTMGITLEPPSPPAHVVFSSQMEAALRDLVAAAGDAFKDLRGTPQSGANGRVWRSRVVLPGATECLIVLDGVDPTAAFCSCYFNPADEKATETWFEDLRTVAEAVLPIDWIMQDGGSAVHKMAARFASPVEDGVAVELAVAPGFTLTVLSPRARTRLDILNGEFTKSLKDVVEAARQRFRKWFDDPHKPVKLKVTIPGFESVEVTGHPSSHGYFDAMPQPRYEAKSSTWWEDRMTEERFERLKTLVESTLGNTWVKSTGSPAQSGQTGDPDPVVWIENSTNVRVELKCIEYVWIYLTICSPPT